MANNGVLNATYMGEHLLNDSTRNSLMKSSLDVAVKSAAENLLQAAKAENDLEETKVALGACGDTSKQLVDSIDGPEGYVAQVARLKKELEHAVKGPEVPTDDIRQHSIKELLQEVWNQIIGK